MTEDDTSPGPYAEPPDGLQEQVVTAVLERLKKPSVRTALEVSGDGKLRMVQVQPLGMYGLSTQQRVSVDALHSLAAPSSWGFAIQVTPDTATVEDTQLIFAAAGALVEGRGYRFSTIINAPESLKYGEMLKFAMERSPGKRPAFIHVPAYQLRAFWVRTEQPKEDTLYFLEPTFGRFPSPGFPKKLSVLVDYMNASLAANAPLLLEPTADGDYGKDDTKADGTE